MRKMRRRRKTEDEKDECRREKKHRNQYFFSVDREPFKGSKILYFFKGYVSKHVGVNKSLGLNIWVVKQPFIYEAGILGD